MLFLPFLIDIEVSHARTHLKHTIDCRHIEYAFVDCCNAIPILNLCFRRGKRLMRRAEIIRRLIGWNLYLEPATCRFIADGRNFAGVV